MKRCIWSMKLRHFGLFLLPPPRMGGPWWWIQRTVPFRRSGRLHGNPVNDIHVRVQWELLPRHQMRLFRSTNDWFMLWPAFLCPFSSQWLPPALALHCSGAWTPRPASFLWPLHLWSLCLACSSLIYRPDLSPLLLQAFALMPSSQWGLLDNSI